MKVKKLGDITFELIIDCFLKSFENYYVEVPSDKNYYKKRWEIAKVDFTLSYGMFDGENIVGFIIHAIDNRHGKKIAFNTGTGVIPEYRGRRIVQAIYDFAIPDLKMNGITQCALEVIIENHKAIKSYQRVGFEICKTYNCFSGAIPLSTNEEIELQYAAQGHPKMCKFFAYNYQCKYAIIHGFCKFHHDKRAIKIYNLMSTGDTDSMEEA